MLPPSSLDERLEVTFRDKTLLEQSLTHSSYLNENPSWGRGSNERLEFLGDALINLVIAQELFHRCSGLPEGELTRLRAHLVKGDSLAQVAEGLRLGEHLLMGKGEEAGGGRGKVSNLAAALEALVGAVFLDQGYETARSLLIRLLEKKLKYAVARGMPKDPKSHLQEMVQSRQMGTPIYRVAEVTGPEHARRFTVEVRVGDRTLGRGVGARKQEAEQAAAEEALKALGG